MLILTRKPNETIIIGDNIEVTLLEIRGDKIRLGIVAPKATPVDRSEIRKLKDKAKEQTP